MNLPNALTISRFLLIPVYIVVFAYSYLKIAFLVVIIAGLTDILDGYIARTKGLVTQLGIMLDPLADKLMMITVFVSLLYSGFIPWEAAFAMFVRDLAMIIGSAYFHFRGKITVPANMMGKMTTVLYYLAVLLIIFKVDMAIYCLWFVILFSFVTSFIYVLKFRVINNQANQEEHISVG